MIPILLGLGHALFGPLIAFRCQLMTSSEDRSQLFYCQCTDSPAPSEFEFDQNEPGRDHRVLNWASASCKILEFSDHSYKYYKGFYDKSIVKQTGNKRFRLFSGATIYTRQEAKSHM